MLKNPHQMLLPTIPTYNAPAQIFGTLTTAANSCTSADTIVGVDATFSSAVIATTTIKPALEASNLGGLT